MICYSTMTTLFTGNLSDPDYGIMICYDMLTVARP